MGVVLFAVIGIGAFAGLVYYFSADATNKRELRKARAFKISELPDGTPGRIIGRAGTFTQQLIGPLTGRPCVYFIAKVEQHVSNGRTSYWRDVITESRGVPFVVEDGTGRAIVDPTAARVTLDFDARSTSGTFDDPTPEERAFLERHGQQGQGWIFNKSLRYREAVIELGETVAVLGSGVREPDPDAPPTDGYRGDPATRVRLTSSPAYPLVISDSADTTVASR